MEDLFTEEEIKSRLQVEKVHPVFGRKISIWPGEDEDEALLSISGGDLPDGFIKWIECASDPATVNWVADALGRAPYPKS